MDGSQQSTTETENISDIQNYLDTFNKEIQDGTSSTGSSDAGQQVSQPDNISTTAYYIAQTTNSNDEGYDPYGNQSQQGSEELLHVMESQQSDAENGTTSDEPTFVAMQPGSGHEAHINDGQALTLITNSDGSKDSKPTITHQPHTIHMVVKQPDGTEMEQTLPITGSGGSTLVTADGQEIHVSEEGTLQMMANLAENALSASADGNNQMILNAGASYQTVTIVPSDTNPGEVSYVLIVSQPDQDKDEKEINLDMSVYDFNEGEKHPELLTGEMTVDVTKMHTMKATPKKSQQVTQAHMCNYCNYTSPKRYLLSRHMKSHSEERPHKCSVCERGFKTLASLQNHVNTHTGTRPHRCKECTSAFTTSGELVRHVRYKHTHEKPHRCTECDYASVELSKLKRHMRCHTGERPYQCPHCTYASPDTYKLKRHLRIHTGEKPYQCDICHAKFTQSNSLKAHKLIHSGNKPVFQCELCPTTCGRKTDLRIHVQKLHNSDKPMKCKRCSKTFSDRYSYKLHVKTHEGEKCFRCDLCSYASISQRHLESHMLIHTDQKPYRCDECDQSFRQKQLLRRHKNLYHTPNYIPPVPKEKTHECSECGKNFRHKGNLIRHMAIHDPDATAAERAAALRIGEPKGPGEQPDGEEDYGEEEYANCISANGTMQVTEEGQQVVVFEVIQLPVSSSNGSEGENHILRALPEGTMTMSSGNNDSQGVTIIQQVQAPSGSLAEEVAAAIAQVHSEEPEDITDLISPLKQQREYEQPRQNDGTALPTSKRGRGRPRKFSAPSESNDSILLPNNRDGEGEEQIETTLLVMETRQGRKKRAAETGDGAETIVTIPPKKGHLPKTGRRGFNSSEVQVEAEEMLLTVCDDPEEMARKDAEVAQKRLQQKQKDMAECFGFNEDEEEDETILSMSAVPGMTVTRNHAALGPTCVTIANNSAATKDADFDHNTQLYTSLQNGSA